MRYFEVRPVSEPETSLAFEADPENKAALDRLEAIFRANWAAGKRVASSEQVEPIRAQPSKDATLPNFMLTSRVLMTCKLAVSSEIKELLETFSLWPCIFHPVVTAKASRSYSLFHYPTALNDSLSFRDSLFFAGSSLGGPKRYHDITDLESYEKLIRKPGGAMLRPEYVEVLPGLTDRFDVLAFRFGRIFFSERCVNAIKDLASGVRFLPASNDADPNRIHFSM